MICLVEVFMSRMPTYFVSHGGGPWPWVDGLDKMHAEMAASFAAMPDEIGATPKAILVISAHWETVEPTVQTSANPPMLYDYGGFPPHTYEVQYSAPGSPELAARVQELLGAAGIAVHADAARGFDHGTFVPLAVAYPDADVPVVQLSIQRHYDPAHHLAIGRALAPLRDEGVLIVGSGFTYHDLSTMDAAAEVPSREFADWLNEVLQEGETARYQAMIEWESAPSARKAHPAEDHLVPLFVAVGAAGADNATRVYHQNDLTGNITASSFRFG